MTAGERAQTPEPGGAGDAPEHAAPEQAAPKRPAPEEPEPVVIRDRRRRGPDAGDDHGNAGDPGTAAETSATPAETSGAPAATEAPAGLGAELESLRAELDERTRDLQRARADFANYKKRVERDRALAGERATDSLLVALLPVLDDLDRAREHGELVEGVAAVADQLVATTGKFGLTPFGEKGDPFDPNRHEAVAHLTSTEVTEQTCVDVLRRGYLRGDRLLRPAMVAVAGPATAEPEQPAPEPSAPGDGEPDPG